MRKEFGKMLVMRRYLLAGDAKNVDKNKTAYFNAYLLSNFGIIVDKPQLLTAEMLQDISTVYKLNVPRSFYDNPQDTKYFTKAELLIEQLVSYFLVETGTGIYERVEIFEKDLPEYKSGTEITLREFKIIDDEEARVVLSDIAHAYCGYTRPFSLEEREEFILLYRRGFVNEKWDISCRDNIFPLLKEYPGLAAFLDKKDIVKYSVSIFGERKNGLEGIINRNDACKTIMYVLPLLRDCRLTKKQAKYYNKLVDLLGQGQVDKVSANSPHKEAIALFNKGDILGAARIYAKSGSLLERNLRMLLSRANPQEALEIIGMLKAKNPIVLFQLVNSLQEEAGKPRTFSFTKNNLVKHHVETEYETKWRKSRLSSGTIKFLHDACLQKIYDYYRSLPSLGKIYVSDAFYKIGLPSNTSANGKGIDVLPTGSRVSVLGTAIRTFVTWKGIYDVDAALTAIKDNGEHDYMYFGNYSSKPFGNDALFSGDDRSSHGTEYFDIKLAEMKARGYRYVIQSFHGYSGRFNEGEVYCGYQNKDDLHTRAWDPKNIALQFRVLGDTRACVAFAIDLETNEIIILNQMVEDESRVVNDGDLSTIEKYLNPNYLDINIGNILENRGVLVDDPADADIVFDDNYIPQNNKEDVGRAQQKVVHSYELEKLVALVNEK